MNGKLKILFLEDNQTDAEIIWRQIRKDNIEFDKELVETKDQFTDALKNFKPDLIISDYQLPIFDGMSALRLRNEIAPGLPFILVTGSINEEVAVDCMKTGADDYILKERLSRLGPAIRSAVERKQIEEDKLMADKRLLESEEKYRKLVDLTPDAVVVHSDGRFLYVNPATLRMLKAKDFEEIRDIPVMKFVHPDSIDSLSERLKKIYDTDEPSEFAEEKMINLKGDELYVEIIGIPINFMGRKAVQTIIRDISERKKIEKKLRDERNLLRTLIDNIPDTIYFFDTDGKKIISNKADYELLGFDSEEQAIGKTDMEVFSGETGKSYHENNLIVLHTGIPKIDMDEEFTDKTGKRIWLQSTHFPIFDQDHNVIGLVGIGHNITARKNAELALLKSRKEFQHYFESGSIGMSVTGPGMEWIQVNDRLCLLLDYTKEEFMNTRWMDLIHDDDKKKNLSLLKYADEGKIDKYEADTRFIKKNGETVFVSLAVVVQRNDNGSVDHFLSSYIDISERKKYEEDVEHERLMLRTLIDNIPDPIYVLDRNCKKIIANKADVRNIGFVDESQVLGKTSAELYKGEEGRVKHADNCKVIKSGEPIISKEEVFRDKYGEQRWYLTSRLPLHNLNGDIAGLVGISYNITDRKWAHEELVKSQALLMNALKIAHLGAWEYDVKKDVFIFNDLFYNLFRTSVADIGSYEMTTSDYLTHFVHPEDTEMVKQVMSEANTTDDPAFNNQLEHRIIFSDGQTGHVIVRYFVVKDERGATFRIYGVNQDITERKKAELELIRARDKAEESDRLKTAFIHNISHEIRTPMNAIVGFSSLLCEPDITEDNRNSFVEVLMNSSNHLLAVVNDIIEIANIEAGIVKLRLSDVNITSTVRNLYDQFRPMAEQKGLDLKFETGYNNKDVIITTDSTKFIQVLNNLVNNALKFTSGGSVDFGYRIDENNVRFFVRDTGIGIPEEMHAKVFDRFFQVESSVARTYEGTGLGLSISKSFIEMLGGDMWVESNSDHGSVFYFTLPLRRLGKEEAVKEIILKDDKGIIKKDKEKILIAEDEHNNYKLLVELLSPLNAELLYASNGKEAVDLCNSHDDIDLILMDIKMPVMDGYDATREIKKTNPDVPVIAITAYAFESDRERAFQAGCNAYLSKPLRRAELIETVTRYLKRSSE
ncbi:MAG TPA: PAS domain S-box protein [Bacteroidales bacterium]|nr:PAS domain S-box protein [Bacteroidales bacterium]